MTRPSEQVEDRLRLTVDSSVPSFIEVPKTFLTEAADTIKALREQLEAERGREVGKK